MLNGLNFSKIKILIWFNITPIKWWKNIPWKFPKMTGNLKKKKNLARKCREKYNKTDE